MAPNAPLPLSLIVAATDFSEGSAHAVRRAAALAARAGAALHLLYVESLMGSGLPAELAALGSTEALRTWGDAAIADAIHPAEPDHVEVFVARDLAPAEGILRHVRDHSADLLVIGTHGRRGLRRFLLGSVAEELVRLAPVPVLTVPYRCATWAGTDFTVLAPVDFSTYSLEALSWARRLAAHYGARLDLLHVVPEAGPYPTFYPVLRRPPLRSLYDLEPDLDAQARIELERFFDESDGPEVDVRFHVRAGMPSTEIVRFANQNPTGAVVMATHGLQGLQHLLLGSTTEKTLRQLTCPAFTLRPDILVDPVSGREVSRADLTGGIPETGDGTPLKHALS